MHAYLFVGSETSSLENRISNLAEKLGARIMEFPILKIEDVRTLNNLIRLSFNKPTLIVCHDIHKAGEEALSAFLKNLEEPQENIFFVLTTTSVKKVLPTIVSRCQVIKLANNRISKLVSDKSKLVSDKSKLVSDKSESRINNEIEEFFKLSTGEKLAYIDKIKDRERAVEFIENMVFFAHGSLHENGVKYRCSRSEIEVIAKTLSRLKANGNVNLQLSNLVIQMSSYAK